MTINHLTNLTNLNLSTTPNFLSNHTASDGDGDFSDHPSTPIHGAQRLTPRYRQVNSSGSSFGSFPTRFVDNHHSNNRKQFRVMMMRNKLGRAWFLRVKSVGVILLMGLFFVANWWILTRIQDSGRVTQALKLKILKANSTTLSIRVCPFLLSLIIPALSSLHVVLSLFNGYVCVAFMSNSGVFLLLNIWRDECTYS